jgi:UDP-glucose 4-epimerase
MGKKKIFITGASGFIGRNLVESLAEKYQVIAPDQNELDLTNQEKVEEFFNQNEIDVVLHCAVKPGHRNAADPSNQLYINMRMFFNLVRNEKKFKKLIFMGSGMVYDTRYYQSKMKEDYFDKHMPEDEGALSKYIISKFIQTRKDMVELRIFGIFGKYEDYAIRFPSNIICKAIHDLPLTMNQNRLFDYIYIKDLIPVVEHFIEKEQLTENVFNVTPDKSIELLGLAKIIKKISGKNLDIVVARKGMGVEYSGDNTRLRNEIPELKFLPIEEAIKDLYQWYEKNPVDKEILLIDK